MRHFAMAAALLMVMSGSGFGQKLQSTDTAAIERAAAAYVARTLPDGVIGFDGTAFDSLGRTSDREASRVDALARVFGAKQVRTDSVYHCPGDPSTCKMSVDALVQVSEPYASPEGARVVVALRLHSGSKRQPIQRVSQELILSEEDGFWKVVGIGRVSAS